MKHPLPSKTTSFSSASFGASRLFIGPFADVHASVEPPFSPTFFNWDGTDIETIQPLPNSPPTPPPLDLPSDSPQASTPSVLPTLIFDDYAPTSPSRHVSQQPTVLDFNPRPSTVTYAVPPTPIQTIDDEPITRDLYASLGVPYAPPSNPVPAPTFPVFAPTSYQSPYPQDNPRSPSPSLPAQTTPATVAPQGSDAPQNSPRTNQPPESLPQEKVSFKDFYANLPKRRQNQDNVSSFFKPEAGSPRHRQSMRMQRPATHSSIVTDRLFSRTESPHV